MSKEADSLEEKITNFFDNLSLKIEDWAEKWAKRSEQKGYDITESLGHNGLSIKTKTINGRTRVRINGDEVIPKHYADELERSLKILVKHTERSLTNRANKALKEYRKYKGKNL